MNHKQTSLETFQNILCFRLVVRIQPPDETHSLNKLGNKYGVETARVRDLLLVARALDLNVVGVR